MCSANQITYLTEVGFPEEVATDVGLTFIWAGFGVTGIL